MVGIGGTMEAGFRVKRLEESGKSRDPVDGQKKERKRGRIFCFTLLSWTAPSMTKALKRDPKTLRSHHWFGPDDLRSFGHRSRLKGMGWSDDDYLGKPVVAI